ncbi:hypothetical protein AUR59_019385 [Stutzerimonas balearica]|uniref:hypothetical protein n=1 Tax=Stutzerimonas balearica TaxID=74829 RepID=UPI000774DB9E|nr:hypothetical protein [Stutzerimonas balearica]OMG61888.1 hypothetical protein AUR59_019385 [Stutzerimonas balearica]
MSEQKPYTPREIDDTEDRMGSVPPLDFSARKDERKGRIGDPVPEREAEETYPPERVAEAGMTEGEVPDGDTTLDDLAPETLIPEDGARSPEDRGPSEPADRDLSVVSEHRIGADVDLDEAEQARYEPLDGKPWDGPADGDADTGLSGGSAVLQSDDNVLEEDDSVLSDDELEGDAPLDSSRDKRPGE